MTILASKQIIMVYNYIRYFGMVCGNPHALNYLTTKYRHTHIEFDGDVCRLVGVVLYKLNEALDSLRAERGLNLFSFVSMQITAGVSAFNINLHPQICNQTFHLV